MGHVRGDCFRVLIHLLTHFNQNTLHNELLIKAQVKFVMFYGKSDLHVSSLEESLAFNSNAKGGLMRIRVFTLGFVPRNK